MAAIAERVLETGVEESLRTRPHSGATISGVIWDGEDLDIHAGKLLREFGPRLSRFPGERFGIRRREARHQRLMANLGVTEHFLSIPAENLETPVRVSRIRHVAKVISKSMIEHWLQCAEHHPRQQPVTNSLNRIDSFAGVHSGQTMIRHLGNDRGIHEK
jgi:hypothetical protein